MKRLLSSLITLSILATSGLFVYADESDDLIPEEILIEEEDTDETEEEYLTEDIEDESVLSEDQEYEEEEQSVEPDAEPEEISDEDIDTSDMDLVEVSCQTVTFVDGEYIEGDIVVDTIDVSDVDASSNTVYSTINNAGDFIRSHAAARDAEISFTVTDNTITSKNINGRIKSALFKHTGIPGQGDNLFFQLYGFTTSWVEYGTRTDITIEFTYYTTAAQEVKVNKEIARVLSSLDLEGKSNTCKICAIYDYICQNVVYDRDHLDQDDYYLQYTSYAALINKKAVCQGYANLFYQMCLAAGVTNVRIDDGESNNGRVSGGHAWNIVKLGNKWYYADPTWDAGYGPGNYSYFLRGSSSFMKNHTSDWDYGSVYSLSSGDYSGWLYHFARYCYRSTGLRFVGGWQKIDGQWYYFGTTGFMSTGWEKINNVWYYFGTDGAMVKGWKKISGKWYYFETSGAMVKGWKKISGKWYYFETSGAMKTGWLKYEGSWYYLDSNGAMAVSTTIRISGKNYKFNSTGVCTNP